MTILDSKRAHEPCRSRRDIAQPEGRLNRGRQTTEAGLSALAQGAPKRNMTPHLAPPEPTMGGRRWRVSVWVDAQVDSDALRRVFFFRWCVQ